MKRYKIDIGRPDGKAGDTLHLTAKSPDDAREQALKSAQIAHNPTWEIQGVYEEV